MGIRNKLLVVSMFAAIFATSAAQAGWLIEPYAGYAMGKVKQTSSEDMKGPFYGLRAGWGMLGFSFGAEYMMGKFKDEDTGAGDEAADNTVADPGIFIAYKFPVMIRAFATYFPSSKIESKDSTGSVDIKGSSMKLGVGFTMLPIVSINFEYMVGSYDEFSTSGLSGALSPEIKTTMYGLSVSAPFDF